MDFTYSESEIVKGKYVFASYQHGDKAIVEDVIARLREKNVNIWHDTNLGGGDNWEKRVETIIRHENCCGVVFFSSENAFRSDPIFLERTITRQELEKRGNDRFFYIPVHIGEPTTLQLIRRLFLLSPTDGKALDTYIKCDQLMQILDMFNSRILSLCLDPENPDACVERLYEDIAKRCPDAIRSQERARQKMEERFQTKQGLSIVPYGRWIGEKVTVPGLYASEENGTVCHQGTEYLCFNGTVYTLEPLRWLLLTAEDDKAVLMCDSLVDIRSGGSSLVEWLQGEFSSMAFSQQETADMLGPVRLLTAQDIASVACAETFARPTVCGGGETQYFWIEGVAFGGKQKVIKVQDGTVYTGGLARGLAVGVRPVIEINYETLMNIK